MHSSVVPLLALAASVVAHPQRHHHHRFHFGSGIVFSGVAAPTGASAPSNVTVPNNGAHLGGSPVEPPVTLVTTVTVRPVPADDFSTAPVAESALASAPASEPASAPAFAPPAPASAPDPAADDAVVIVTDFATCTRTVYLTAVVTSTPPLPSTTDADLQASTPAPNSGLDAREGSVSLSAGTPMAAAFFGRPSAAAAQTWGAGSSAVAAPTTLATVAGSAPASGASASAAASGATYSAPPSTGGGSSGGKKGLSYNDASLTDAFAGKGISWAYNWGASPGGSIVSGAEFVPMLWGPGFVSAWSGAAQSAISAGATHALSFNEPDLGSQSNIDPATAAKLHIENMNPLAGQVQIGSPAITNGAGTSPLMGIDWLNEFFNQCAGNCKVDFVAFHWYDSASNYAYFQQHVQDVINAAAQHGVSKVWLTEYGASGSDSDVANFISKSTAFLESTPAVERYAYFMCSNGILVNGGSVSSPIGEAYA